MDAVPTTTQDQEGADLVHSTDHARRVLSHTTQSAREIMASMPEQMVRDGGAVDWGASGNKARALYIAALLGHAFDPKCQSCESDLYYVIKNAAK